MAARWPKEANWPHESREHATYLSKYLREALLSIDQGKDQSVPAVLVRAVLIGALSFVMKTQTAPDFQTLLDSMNVIRSEQQATATTVSQTLGALQEEIRNSTELVSQANANTQKNMELGEEAKVTAREAIGISRNTMTMISDLKDKSTQVQSNGQVTYATITARNTGMNTRNTQSLKTSPAQIRREIIVNIRNPLTIQSLRAMNPRHLKTHVERAIEQSGNEHIVKVKIASANQLKSGDLNVKTATSTDMQILRQFTDDWAPRIGDGTSVRNPTYGVLAHGIRTSTMNMDNFQDLRNDILQDNKPFIPMADIKYIGWLTRTAPTKSASTIIIEFTRPEDANKIIDEGLVWQGEVFQCERYERQCRLKQCFNCQRYGHIGTQCKAITACGYCAGEHNSRDCTAKADYDTPRKCATCLGAHEAWSQQCPTRKDELAKTRTAYENRQQYHAVIEPPAGSSQPETTTRPLTRRRSARDLTDILSTQPDRDTSPPRRRRKRTNVEILLDSLDKENQGETEPGSQRPQRAATQNRKALQTLESNTLQHVNRQYMEIDDDDEEL